MIYCTAARQQLCVGNKALAPKLFMRYNKRIVAVQSVCRWGQDSGKSELRRGEIHRATGTFLTEMEIGSRRVRRVRFRVKHKAETSPEGRATFRDLVFWLTLRGLFVARCSSGPVETSRSSTTKRRLIRKGRKRRLFKRHILMSFTFHVAWSFELVSHPRANKACCYGLRSHLILAHCHCSRV